MLPEIVGSVGAGLLLAGFALNVAGRISERGRTYLFMNLVGAGLSAWYAWEGRAMPLVVLEGVWAAVAAARLFLSIKKGSPREAGNPS